MLLADLIFDNHDRPDKRNSPDEGLMSHDSPTDPPSNEPTEEDFSDRLPKIIPFDQLARCGDEIWIECNGQIYRLRRTRQGKLILTK